MKVTVLGSGSAYSSPTRFNSCYHIESCNERFMIDCGSDAMRAMQKAGIDFFSVREIFITHMHADHAAGLPAVLTAMHVQERKDPLKVYIPFPQIEFAGLWLANMFLYNERMSFGISLVPLEPGLTRLSEAVGLEFIQTRHLEKYSQYAMAAGITPVSFSVIVRERGKRFLFSSDLESIDEVRSYLPGCVSFIEATHPPLDELARLSNSRDGEVYFTHIPKELEDGGEWRNELAARYGIKELNSVNDGQIIVL